MDKKPVTAIRFSDRFRGALDRAAGDLGTTRSALIRTVLNIWLKKNGYL